MRLINCSTLQLEEFFGTNILRYVILSHTWGDEEVSFADFRSLQPTTRTRSGYQKILSTCQQALRDELNYAWIDTACIDKSSSAELSEAINSMFTWYTKSAVCYAYLSDVSEANLDEEFPTSRWFTRGWTLQELLAPGHVIFFDQQWHDLGSKDDHAEWISEITRIDVPALIGSTDINGDPVGLGAFCVAKRMSWASLRQTTRAEDMAYCLLGIFDINMPLLYGEGDRAFLRLQEEIIRKVDDDSILAWGLNSEMDHPLGPEPEILKRQTTSSAIGNILASSPKDFANCVNLSYGSATSSFTLTNTGLQIQLPLLPVSLVNHSPQAYFSFSARYGGRIGLLSCSTGSNLEFLGILLYPKGEDDSTARVYRAGITIPGASYSTVVVGLRAAARSILQTVTITKPENSQRVRFLRRGYQQILVNETDLLQSIGYQVKNGIVWSIMKPTGRVFEKKQIWDLEARILTIKRGMALWDTIEFCFTPLPGRRGIAFTVFTRTISSRALVREGDSFSEDDRRNFHDYLGPESPQPDIGYIVIHDSEGGLFRVSVEVHATKVYDNRLFEVNVDAVQIAGGDS